MKSFLLALAAAAGLATGASAAELPKVAVFEFALTNTSGAQTTQAELERLKLLDRELDAELTKPGRYTLVDTSGVKPELANVQSIRGCNGCEIDLARKAGADLAAYGWVQKVSNLILNVNLVIEEVSTGHIIKADSTDIRSNTDESWSRGLKFLVNERLFRED